ncbi:hypothetical protein FG386_002685 [Cryptosporidium ryanae]|uniref:uncharacterized protein n=1 Tax=Cryptosporidium ryanae TaxID=515981 RepID=UPI00351A501F|nr:hypothetical protein FG386_002685 [Cryptosporidium ryanae]
MINYVTDKNGIDENSPNNKMNVLSVHEQVLATKYLSRYRSFHKRLHSPVNGNQTKRGISIYLDEYNDTDNELNLTTCKKNSRLLFKDLNNLELLDNLRTEITKMKTEVTEINDYSDYMRHRNKIENIMKKYVLIKENVDKFKNNEYLLTKKLALIKNSFKTTVIQNKKIERELYRNRFFWQEYQIGMAPAINNNILRKRKNSIHDNKKDKVKEYTSVHVENDIYSNNSKLKLFGENANNSNNIKTENHNGCTGIIDICKSQNNCNSSDVNDKDQINNFEDYYYESKGNNTYDNINTIKSSINSMNNYYYGTQRDTEKSEFDCNETNENIDCPHYNTMASNNNELNAENNNNNKTINFEYIDDEIYRDGLIFNNILNYKNSLISYSNETPYQILNSIQLLDNDFYSNEKIANSILNKRKDYINDFTRKLEIAGINLDIERSLYLKKSRLFKHQQNSKYNNMNTLSVSQSYTLLNMIGKGGFAEVWEVLNMNTLNITAAKIHELTPDMTEHERIVCVERVSNEIKLHRDLKHPNIVNMLHCFEVDNDRLVTIMELCDGPDLDTFIKTNGYIPEKLAIIWIRQILEGILYLNNIDKEGKKLSTQRNSIIHYDLKPGNIILHRGCCKIADFGLSKMVDSVSESVIIERIGGGTVWYQPPEILLRPGDSIDSPRVINHKVDIWAIGCIFYEILHLRRPFGLKSSSVAEAFSLIPIEAKMDLLFDTDISQECKSYIKWLLTYDSEKRPNILEAYSHPLIQNVTKIS